MKAILFDLFGTLVPNIAPEAFVENMRDMARTLGVAYEEFVLEWRKGFQSRMNGEIQDGDRQFIPILKALGKPIDPAALAKATAVREGFLVGCLTPKSDALESLAHLKQRGLKLGMVTDCSSATPRLLEGTELGRYLPVRAASALLRTRKPDPRMYQHVMEGLHVAGAECLYVGDGNSAELPGAKRLGLRTVWVDNGDKQYWKDRFVPEADHTIRTLGELVSLVDFLLDQNL